MVIGSNPFDQLCRDSGLTAGLKETFEKDLRPGLSIAHDLLATLRGKFGEFVGIRRPL